MRPKGGREGKAGRKGVYSWEHLAEQHSSELGKVVHPCNPSTLKAEAGRLSQFQASPSYINSSQPGLQSEALSQINSRTVGSSCDRGFQETRVTCLLRGPELDKVAWSYTAGYGQDEIWNHSLAFPGTVVPKP